MSSKISQFLASIDHGDDSASEQLVAQLSLGDEPALLELAKTGNIDQRWWALRALALIGSTQAVTKIVAALNDIDLTIRAVAAMALGQLHQRHPSEVGEHLPALAAHLADEEGSVRQAALEALAQCGDAALPALVEVLRGDHQAARTRAAMAVRKIAQKSQTQIAPTMAAAGVLYRCLNDGNYLVHTYAYEGLDELGLLETLLLAV